MSVAVAEREPLSPPPAPAERLEVIDLVAAYGKSVVVDRVGLTVRAGEIVVLLGRNGAGKTTTLRSIAGVHPPLSGRVRLEDTDVTALLPYRRVRAGLAMVPSGARAFGSLSVEENLTLVTGKRAAGGGWSLERVYALFPKLRTLRRAASGSLSGGERQMLAVGRALMANPSVIMLDEPSEGLAPVIVQSIARLLSDLRDAGIAVLLAEQNHHMALRVADRCYFIEKGRIAFSGAAAEARESAVVRRFLGI
jgi:branched-chain amino acid transport system ATP-binding protein